MVKGCRIFMELFGLYLDGKGLMMKPAAIYYERDIFDYELGRKLKDKFDDRLWIPIDSHNNIPKLRSNPNSEFVNMKNLLIIGTRKTHKYVPNQKVSDYLVPFTSSGCSAMCLYCYLVCNYNKCSYLRLFVNREQMMDKLIRTAGKSDKDLVFEIGSNSDLILENQITENLPWVIEEFGRREKGYLTFPSKFSMVEPILNVPHRGRTIFRMSVNPQEIISQIEFGTSDLKSRIRAFNKIGDAGYKTGLLIAPVILVDGWKNLYIRLLDVLGQELSGKIKEELFFEIIFMTYSYVHNAINTEAFPDAVKLYEKEKMTGRGRGKYCYKNELRIEGEVFFRSEIAKRFPHNKILYIV